MSAPRQSQSQIEGQSLSDRVASGAAASLRRGARPRLSDWRRVVALAAIVALAPLLTILGARGLADRVAAENRALAGQMRVQDAPAAARRAAAARLRAAAQGVGLVALVERVARVLPAEDRLLAAARSADGTLTLEIAARDPDVLRGALRRDPVLATLRESGQRRAADARVIVTWRSRS